MPKALTICGMTVAALVVLLFGFDLGPGLSVQQGQHDDGYRVFRHLRAGLHELVDLPRTSLTPAQAADPQAAAY